MTERLQANYVFTGDVRMTGTGRVPDASVTDASIDADAAIARSKLAQDTFQRYGLDLLTAVVHDAPATRLPATPAADDLGITGAFGTGSVYLTTGDVKAAGAVTRYARLLFTLPPEYDTGGTVQVRVRAGMLTTVADTSATADVEVYKSNGETGIGSDLVTTVAQDMNSLNFANLDFTVTATSLAPGDPLDIRVAVATNDTATATTVEGVIGAVWVLLDIRG